MRHLNVKLTLWLLGITLVLVVGVHLLHGYQLDRNADILRVQAEQAEQSGNTKEAVKQYNQYLKYRDDPKGYSALAALVVTSAQDAEATRQDKIRAYNILEEAIRRHPDLVDVRRRLIDYTMLMHRWTETLEHIQHLADSGDKTPDLDLKAAQCHMGNGEETSAINKLYEIVGFDDKASQFTPDPPGKKEVAAFEMLAQVLRRKTGDLDRADAVMTQLVTLNPDLAKAHLARANYLAATERPKDAKTEIERAFELGPDDIEVLVAVASQATADREFDKAQQLLDKAAEKNPERADVYIRLAQLAYSMGNSKLATEHLERGGQRAAEPQNIFPMLLEFQFQSGDLDAARSTHKQMQDRGTYPPEFLRFANARIQFTENNFWEASRELEAVRPAIARSAYVNYLQQLDLLLGRCYEALGMHDRQLEVARRVLQSAPSQVAARLSEATALQNLGRHEESAIDVGLLVANVNNFKFMAGDVLQLLINSIMRKPPEQRDWAEAEKIAAIIYENPERKPLDNELLKSDLLLLQDRRDEAQTVLFAARKQFPKELAVWMALIRFFQRDETPEGADKLGKALTLAEKELGPIFQLRLERVRLAMRLGGDQMVETLAKLEADGEKFDEPQRIALMSQLGLGYLQARDYEGTKRCWKFIADKDPRNAQIRQILFELAIDFKDEAGVRDMLKDIHDSRNWGSQSPLYKYCSATALVRPLIMNNVKTLSAADKKSVEEAHRLVDEAIAIRGEWSQLWRVRAEIDQLEGNVDGAITNYKRALEFNHAGQTVVARRLVQLLYMRHRFAEANEALKYVGQVKSNDPIHKMATRITFEEGQTGEALEMAEKDALEDPSNPANQIGYGQLLEQVGRSEEAEKAFRQATVVGAQLPQTWDILVRHLMGNKKSAEALAAIREAAEPLAKNPVALAMLYETVSDRAQAEHYYQEALTEHPDDPNVIHRVVEFYFKSARGNPLDVYMEQIKKAEPLLDQLVKKYGGSTNEAELKEAGWARRAQAEITATSGDYDNVVAATKLIEQNARGGKLGDDDIVAIISMLANRNEPDSRAKCVRMLEQLQKQRPLQPREQMALGQLYERAGKWSQGKELMVSALTRQGNDPASLAAFSQTLVRRDELEDGARWLDKLDELLKKASLQVAEAYKPVSRETRARLLIKTGQKEQAVQVIETLVPRPLPPSQLSRLRDVSSLLEELGQFEAAEKLLLEYMSADSRGTIAMASFLGRRGEIEKCLYLLKEARKNQTVSELLPCALEAMRAHPDQATPERFKMLEEWANDGLQNESNTQQIKLLIAEIYDIQGRYPDLINVYRELLADKDATPYQKAIVKNNLAFVLSLKKETSAEAEKLIGEAIQVMGPTSDLLDTRALAYLGQGKVKLALADLQSAATDSPSVAKYFHLAQAEKQANNIDAARTALAQAQKLGVDLNRLTPMEREGYLKIVDELK